MEKAFVVTIEDFEGPLDLMLHLIKESKLDLFALDILILTKQYTAYIKAMEEMNLEIASEYLVELANLLEYKSRKLLPRETMDLTSDYEDGDPDELVKRLLEYQKYKDLSMELERLAKEREKMLEKPPSSLIDQWISEGDTKIEPMAVYHLFNAMERCFRRTNIIEPLKQSTTRKEMTIEERIQQLKVIISKLKESFIFDDLCNDGESRMLIIMTFLAILEMLKNQELIYRVKSDIIHLQRGRLYAG